MYMLCGRSGQFVSLKFILLGLLLIVKPKCAGNDSVTAVKYIYIIIEPVDNIPESETCYNELTKDLNCTEGLKPAYVPDRSRNVTVLGCFENKPIFNHNCPELNQGTLQENFYASCANFSPSCPSPYYVWESFKYPDCFRNNTGIDQEKQEKQEKNCYCTINTWLLIMLIISLVCNCFQIPPSIIFVKKFCERRNSSIEIKNTKKYSTEEEEDAQEHLENKTLHDEEETQTLMLENESSIQMKNSVIQNNSKDARKEEEDAQEPLENGTLHDEEGEALIQSLIPSSDIVTQESLSVSVVIEN